MPQGVSQHLQPVRNSCKQSSRVNLLPDERLEEFESANAKLKTMADCVEKCNLCPVKDDTAICVQAQTANIFTRLFTLYNMTFGI